MVGVRVGVGVGVKVFVGESHCTMILSPVDSLCVINLAVRSANRAAYCKGEVPVLTASVTKVGTAAVVG